MSIYAINDKSTIAHLFEGWDETMIWSCLQDCMGLAYADSLDDPSCAQISLGDFCFLAGVTNDDIIGNRPQNLHSDFAILVPQNISWERAIECVWGENAHRRMRYATKKEWDVFDFTKLQSYVSQLPKKYELKLVDSTFYHEIRLLSWAKDLCSNYANYEEYEALGFGIVVIKNGDIVSGASSYTSFNGGIEIEIDTREDERRKGLALACAAELIMECRERGLYPSWDAHNKASLALAEKLGYTFDKEYPVYEICFH
ncbi:MAG: GNAT family N-acetyltransferase [Lachnospiraceae bacterium]